MTMRITSLSLSRGVLDDVQRASLRLAKTQQKLSSGKELTRPSDDPPAVGRALQLRAEMEGASQLQRNASEALGWSDVTDSVLRTINDNLQRARELTVQGASDTAGGVGRIAIAQEMRGIIDSIKEAANSQYGGRYILSGTAIGTQPYAVGPTATDAFLGEPDQFKVQIGPAVTIDVNVHGREVIGDETGGLLFALRSVVANLESEDGPGLVADLEALDGALDDLNAVRARVGATTNRLEVASARLAEYEGTTLKLLSDTEDADFAKAMVDFSIQQSALQAGLKAGASIVQNSLLDFLR